MVLSLEEIKKWCEDENRELWEYMLEDDVNKHKISRQEVWNQMVIIFDTMLEADEAYDEELTSNSGMVGGSGGKLEAYSRESKEYVLAGEFMNSAMVVAIKMAESNACMRKIVAAPTAGSCGVIPAVLLTYYRNRKVAKEDMVKSLFVAGAIGEVIAERASISGAAGGCQAEIGSASAMASGALIYLLGGDIDKIYNGVAISLKNLLGLVCDPVAGLVEVPCVKRNVVGVVNAISTADMVMAGIESVIPADEVIDAMAEIGEKLDYTLKETALGGIAATPTAMKY
ncbi:MAG: L-serine ammonia-lyase, iron-sulfur-dependent, subunit alpha [Eubacterium sp.]|nr:L-serine ammonia-lyase, iron-sulfur-dependent, subunit alpha [Eubacterium sp.]